MRDVRLRALAADPDAFGPTLDGERDLAADRWRERVTGAAWFLSHPLGLVGATREDDDAVLSGMWVSPTARGQGVGRLLVGAVDAWAAGQGATRLVARVFDDNAPALGLWAALGFAVDGPVVVSRRDPSRTWRTWVRPVVAATTGS
ncbi:GNAT family N-acetyltransferase [Klenkia brasiliensis]|uniref:GNAT family N-acetyltransferase n=1 Tax=Klenkia brasiliensis TaxID=333142 RepID=UPI001F60E01C|nr:GNAT family N-acetyltransferase [Klenkia brasiliensis]